MNTDDMRQYLYNEYTAISLVWDELLVHLEAQIREISETRRNQAELKNDLDLYESSVLLAETHKEGRINGPNEHTRKHQAAVLLAALPEEDPEYAALIEADQAMQTRINELACNIEALQHRISFLHNRARMVAGLSYSLAGV